MLKAIILNHSSITNDRLKMIKLANRICLSNHQVHQSSKRFMNMRISKSGKFKTERLLNMVSAKMKKVELELQQKANVKKSISAALDIVQGEDVFRKRQEVLNKAFLEAISEIISNHSDFEKIPRLNINNIETNRKLTHVKIFWNFTENDPNQIEHYTTMLNGMITDIRTSLRHNYYRNSPPELAFVYDISDGVNSNMEMCFKSAKEATSKCEHEPFDPAKLFAKEKLIKKEFDIKSLIPRDPSVDFPRDEKNPTKFRHPYEMNLFMYNLDFKRIYEQILFQISQGKSKRTLSKLKTVNETMLSPYIVPPMFRESDLNAQEMYEMPLTEDRVQLMKKFVIASKKKVQRRSKDLKKEMFDRLDDNLDKHLDSKQRMDEKYRRAEDTFF